MTSSVYIPHLGSPCHGRYGIGPHTSCRHTAPRRLEGSSSPPYCYTNTNTVGEVVCYVITTRG